MPRRTVVVSVWSPVSMAPSRALPFLLRVRMVPAIVWGHFGNPARGKQECSCHPSLMASQWLSAGCFLWCF